MENDIVAMSDGDFDDHIELLSTDEAKSAVSNLMRDARNPDHSYVNTYDIDHGRTVERMSKLQAVAHPPEVDPETGKDRPAGRFGSTISKAMGEALEEKAAQQNVVREQMKDDMNFLVDEGGFARDSIPKDPKPYQANALKMQRLNAEGKHAEIVPIMQKELNELRAPAETAQLFETFVQAELDSSLREPIFEAILRWIHDARKTQLKGSQ